MYKLFIDDERFPVEEDCVIVRSSKDAMGIVKARGIPVEFQFDHDLGCSDTTMVFLGMLLEYMLDNKLQFPYGFKYFIHSQNPVGARNIRSKMDAMIGEFGIEKASKKTKLLEELKRLYNGDVYNLKPMLDCKTFITQYLDEETSFTVHRVADGFALDHFKAGVSSKFVFKRKGNEYIFFLSQEDNMGRSTGHDNLRLEDFEKEEYRKLIPV